MAEQLGVWWDTLTLVAVEDDPVVRERQARQLSRALGQIAELVADARGQALWEVYVTTGSYTQTASAVGMSRVRVYKLISAWRARHPERGAAG